MSKEKEVRRTSVPLVLIFLSVSFLSSSLPHTLILSRSHLLPPIYFSHSHTFLLCFIFHLTPIISSPLSSFIQLLLLYFLSLLYILSLPIPCICIFILILFILLIYNVLKLSVLYSCTFNMLI